MTGIFCELLSIKKAETALQNKETTVQSYWKMSDQNTKKIPGIEVAFFNRAGEIMDNFHYLNSSQYFYFVCIIKDSAIINILTRICIKHLQSDQ